MKRILVLLCFILGLARTASAIDEVHVVPFATKAGITENDWETYFSVNMNNISLFRAIQFDICLPKGMTLLSTDPDAVELNSDRFPGKVIKKVWYPNHTVSVSSPSESRYRIIIYSLSLDDFIGGNEGEIMKMYYLTSPDMKPGIYPITIKKMVLAIDSHNRGEEPDSTTSFVKIDAPQNASLALGGHVAADVSSALADETEIKRLDIQNVASISGTLTLKDGMDLIPPSSDVKAESVVYTRPMIQRWGTICLPFSVAGNDKVQFYRLDNVNQNAMTFRPSATLEAGEPAVVELLDGNELSIEANDVVIKSGTRTKSENQPDWTMKGCYERFVLDPTAADYAERSVYYISDNMFFYANRAFEVGTYRGWFETPLNSPSAVRAYQIAINAPVSGLNAVTNTSSRKTTIYNTQGQSLNVPAKGQINIINGQKVFAK